MLKRFPLSIGLALGAAIASASVLVQSAIAAPLLPPPSFQAGAAVQVDTNAPLCYIQFQGSRAIDVSNVCGKSGEAPDGTSVSVSVMAPPVFNPKVTNASTTGQCNFIDANGNPCPQK